MDTTYRLRLVAAVGALTLLAGCATPGADDLLVGASDTSTTSPAPTTGPYGVALDVLEDGTLHTLEGSTFSIPGRPSYVVRVPLGWLYGPAQGPVTLLKPDGTTRVLAATVNRQSGEMPATPVLSADGGYIAWSETGTVYTGRLTASGVQDVRSSAVPGDTYPVLWAGSRVVLGQTYDDGCCGYRWAEYDVWDPGAGNFVPSWTRDLAPLYGPVPAGAGLFAVQKSGDGACLVQLDAVRDLSATATACVPGLMYAGLGGSLSPDGGHLIHRVEDGALGLFDLDTVLETAAPLRTCAGDVTVAWEDGDTALVEDSSNGTISRCSADGAATGPIAGLTTGSLTLVPRLG